MPAYKGSKLLGKSPNADATEDSDEMYRARKNLADSAGATNYGIEKNEYYKEAAARVKQADTLKKLKKDQSEKESSLSRREMLSKSIEALQSQSKGK